MTFQQLENEVIRMRHLMTMLQTLLHSYDEDGPSPDTSTAANFIAAELQQQLDRVHSAVRAFGAPEGANDR